MRCLLVLSALVALASAASLGYNDNGDAAIASLVPQPEGLSSAPESTSTAKPKEVTKNEYQLKYGLEQVEKDSIIALSLEGDSDDLNKAFFEYTNSRDQVYRTDYIADAAHRDHVL